MGFVGNYAPCGLSPQTDGMPVIQKEEWRRAILLEADNVNVVTYQLFLLFPLICLKRYQRLPARKIDE